MLKHCAADLYCGFSYQLAGTHDGWAVLHFILRHLATLCRQHVAPSASSHNSKGRDWQSIRDEWWSIGWLQQSDGTVTKRPLTFGCLAKFALNARAAYCSCSRHMTTPCMLQAERNSPGLQQRFPHAQMPRLNVQAGQPPG